MKPTVLVIDDEKTFRIVAEEALSAEGFVVATASSGQAGLLAWQRDPCDLVILDRHLPDTDGIAVLEVMTREARERSLDTLVVIATAYADVASAVQALKLGAFDYLSKPLQLPEFVVTVRKAIEAQRLRAQVRQLAGRAQAAMGDFIAGASAAMRKVIDMVDKVAEAPDTTVLIQGESGTGKELIADLIARRTVGRKDGPFVEINCASVPESLLESELFGHERGAFTDAKTQKRGLFEEADGGTLLLDEVGEMPVGTQAKLLKVLEEMTFRRLGGTRDLSINVRVVAATNKELADEVEKGAFRLDLYHRLDVFHIRVPPLRERPEDILPLGDALPGPLRHPHAQAGRPVRARDRAPSAGVRLPRQRARAAERDRAGGDPLDPRGDRRRLHHPVGPLARRRGDGGATVVLLDRRGRRGQAARSRGARARLYRPPAGLRGRQPDRRRPPARRLVPDHRQEDRRLRPGLG